MVGVYAMSTTEGEAVNGPYASSAHNAVVSGVHSASASLLTTMAETREAMVIIDSEAFPLTSSSASAEAAATTF